MEDDRQLLSAFRQERSDQAFAAITRRYLDLVYSAACRQVHDADLARDVTQAVFLLLARKAASLDPETLLAAWLYRTTRFVSMEAIRAEKRRKLREESMASAMHQDGTNKEIWKEIAPHLDEAMDRIPETDRHAILLRFFEDRSLREVGTALGLSEEAAKKRVSRALEKLRAALAREGVKSTGSLLGTALIGCAVQPAPTALAASILPAIGAAGSAATAVGAASGTHAISAELLAKGTVQMMTYTKMQAGAAAAVLLLVAGGTGYIGVDHIAAYHESRRGDVFAQAAKQVDETLAAQKQLLAQAEQENQQLRQQARELYRLRDTATRLRSQDQSRAGEAPVNALSLGQAPAALRESAEKLRELQYEHYVAAGQKALALEPLRPEERTNYIPEIDFMKNVGLALRIYAADHGDEFPADLETLLATDLLDENRKEQVRSGKYEYIRFSKAESKPSLPALWWRTPDERGIRIVAMNDGSVQTMREPADVQKPGYLALTETAHPHQTSNPEQTSNR